MLDLEPIKARSKQSLISVKAFAYYARTDIPALVAEIELLREQLEQAKRSIAAQSIANEWMEFIDRNLPKVDHAPPTT